MTMPPDHTNAIAIAVPVKGDAISAIGTSRHFAATQQFGRFWRYSGHCSALAHIANSDIFPAQSLKQGTKCQISTTSAYPRRLGGALSLYAFDILGL
jgi:hypothetical protein